MAGIFDDLDPGRAAGLMFGLHLMGNRGGGRAWGEAGEKALLTSEAIRKRRSEEAESEQVKKMRELQMQQVQQAMALQQQQMAQQQQTAQQWAQIGQRFNGQQQAAPAGPVGPLNPEMSPVDAAMLTRNNQQAKSKSAFPFTWDEVLEIKAKTRGQIDLTGDYKDSLKTEEVKPGTWQRNARGEMVFVPAVDIKEGMTGGPDGVRSIPGFEDVLSRRELSKQRAGALAGAEMDMVTIVDPRPGSPTQGKQITVPRSEAIALSRQANGFGPQQQAPQPSPQPAQAPTQGTMPTQRPNDRQQILQDELAAEQAKLAELTSTSPANLKLKYGSAFDPRAQLERTQNNIAGLSRELGIQPSAPSAQSAGMSPPISPEQARVDRERGAEVELMRNKARVTFQNVGTVLENVQAALPLVNRLTTGFTGAKLAKIEGTDAFQLRASIEPIKAALGFDQLQLMREFSKTGGALGQVAIPELVALQGRIRNLNADQQESFMRANLLAIEKHYIKFWEIMRDAYKNQYGIDLADEIPEAYSGSAGMKEGHTDSLIKNYLGGKK